MFGWVVHKQVNLVHLAMHLYQLGFKIATDVVEDGFEPVESIGVEYLGPILSQEDQMDMKLRDAMPTAPNLSWNPHRPNDIVRVCEVKTNVQIASVSESPVTRKTTGHGRRVPRTVQYGKAVREDVRAVHSQVLQDGLRRINKTFQAFFSLVVKVDTYRGFLAFGPRAATTPTPIRKNRVPTERPSVAALSEAR